MRDWIIKVSISRQVNTMDYDNRSLYEYGLLM